MKYISGQNLENLLEALRKDYAVYVPEKKGSQRFFRRYSGMTPDVVLGEVRTFEPLKAFFFRARQLVAQGFSATLPPDDEKPAALVGVKSCDLGAFRILDGVFSDSDYPDPFYLNRREQNLVISADCTEVIDTCFCLAAGLKPWPEAEFDLNLSPAGGGYLAQIGSDRGRQLVDRHPQLFAEAKDEFVARRAEARQEMTRRVAANIRKDGVPEFKELGGAVAARYDSELWRDEAQTCVECGACNTVCPTCHCFLLYDREDGGDQERLRAWDSCLLKDFARVAGGANPRPELWMRLRNRFEKKFDFFPRVANVYACTGCGRCVSACPAKIDIRRVLRRLVSDERNEK